MRQEFWFFDAAPFDDLGLTNKGALKYREVYVIAGVCFNSIDDLVELETERRSLSSVSLGRKIVKVPDLVNVHSELIEKYIKDQKITAITGTIFHHYAIPEPLRKDPRLYNNGIENGLWGMRARTFAQAIWIPMERLKRSGDREGIVFVDQENKKVRDSIEYHFYQQFPSDDSASLKIQSIDKGIAGSKNGHIISDIIASIQSRALINKEIYGASKNLLRYVLTWNSNIMATKAKDGIHIQHRTEPDNRGFPFFGDHLKLNERRKI